MGGPTLSDDPNGDGFSRAVAHAALPIDVRRWEAGYLVRKGRNCPAPAFDAWARQIANSPAGDYLALPRRDPSGSVDEVIVLVFD